MKKPRQEYKLLAPTHRFLVVYNSHTSSYAKKGRISTRCVATTMAVVVEDRQNGRIKWREPTSRFPLRA